MSVPSEFLALRTQPVVFRRRVEKLNRGEGAAVPGNIIVSSNSTLLEPRQMHGCEPFKHTRYDTETFFEGWLRMNSIRHRLKLLLLGGLASLIILGAAVLYPAVKHIIVGEFDYALLAKANTLTTLPGLDRRGLSLNFTERDLPEFQPGQEAEYFEIWLSDGSVLARSASLGQADLLRPRSPIARPQFWNVILPAGREGRAVRIGLFAEGEKTGVTPDFTMVLARSRAHLDRIMAGLLVGLALGGALLMLALAWLVQRSVRVGLQPVEDLAAHVNTVDAASLGTRFPVEDLPRELRPIAEQLNQLLDRLGAAFERERRFSANAAHELYTPVAELRALAEVELGSRGDFELPLARDALDIAQKMQRTVEALLALTKCEAQSPQLREQIVDVSQLIEEVGETFADQAGAKSVRWRFSLAPDISAKTDQVMFRSMIVNLAENAVDYTPSGGEVIGRLETVTNGFVFTLANTTDSLTDADLPNLFEPLWRKDRARTDRAHAGLGLSLVKAMAEGLGIEIRADLIRQDFLQMTLRQVANGAGEILCDHNNSVTSRLLT
jgi:signal transduction histidine kinase